MPTVTYVHPDGTKHEVEVPAGKRVMQAAIGAGIDGIVAECGGQAMCATCHVYVESPWSDKFPAISEEEDEMLEDTVSPRTESSRLSCQLVVTDEVEGLIVQLPQEQV
ncbi:2Fe-2S iron-sulfur cluster binding domain-containing protein [Rhodococcus pseudokoreensis]|uniref:2Fe-2S iron-sulfur cluster binding domain-containing protein n=1 Tax=Rhodococcus pseudokoreensis TaxID=2811421 RepID=A0A974ZT58_9NOCA|nr:MULTISPECIES: 2Fe-2S iron-sulfur cluster-binding protein [Rhodococcus]OUS92503.1 ferredoxin [Rhodococcus sp. NCIMB 12038]QSE89436.1 2Fe-2S iron-sulfur cluster binding domain-containing protein [Rhodococcus pseudokoreensis]